MLKGEFPVEYTPKELGIISSDLTARTSFWDTAGRMCSYQSDVLVLMFSVVNYPSFVNAKARWFVEARHHCPQTPILLVGTKSDLRGKQGNEWEVLRQQVDELLSELNLAGYVECSAKHGTGLRGVFDEAFRLSTEVAIIYERNKKKKDCSTM